MCMASVLILKCNNGLECILTFEHWEQHSNKADYIFTQMSVTQMSVFVFLK